MKCCFKQSTTIFHFPFFFLNHAPTTEIYTLSLHDALPILRHAKNGSLPHAKYHYSRTRHSNRRMGNGLLLSARSEEHTSELQSRQYLVCRLLLEKKKKNNTCR